MASLFERGSKIWITLKDENGKWIQRSTGYRHSNIIEKRAAEKLCRMQTLRERAGQPTRHGDWDWVDTWVNATWGGRGTTTTSARYSARWGMLLKFLKERGIAGPANLTREHCLEYVGWREKRGGGRNTTLDELQLLAQVIDEGIRREYCDRNPARKPGLKHDDRKEKRAWTDEELQRVDVELATRDPYNWMRVSFLLGRYQAA